MFAFEKQNLWSENPRELWKFLYNFEAPDPTQRMQQKESLKDALKDPLKDGPGAIEAKVNQIDSALFRVASQKHLNRAAQTKVFQLVLEGIKRTEAANDNVKLKDVNGDNIINHVDVAEYIRTLDRQLNMVINADPYAFQVKQVPVDDAKPPIELAVISPAPVKVDPGVTAIPTADSAAIEARILAQRQGGDVEATGNMPLEVLKTSFNVDLPNGWGIDGEKAQLTGSGVNRIIAQVENFPAISISIYSALNKGIELSFGDNSEEPYKTFANMEELKVFLEQNSPTQLRDSILSQAKVSDVQAAAPLQAIPEVLAKVETIKPDSKVVEQVSKLSLTPELIASIKANLPKEAIPQGRWREVNTKLATALNIPVGDNEANLIAFGTGIQKLVEIEEGDGKLGEITRKIILNHPAFQEKKETEEKVLVDEAPISVAGRGPQVANAANRTGTINDTVPGDGELLRGASEVQKPSLQSLYQELSKDAQALTPQAIMNALKASGMEKLIPQDFLKEGVKNVERKTETVRIQGQLKTLENAVVITPNWGNAYFGVLETPPSIILGKDGEIVVRGFAGNMTESQFTGAKEFSQFLRNNPAKKDASFWNESDWKTIQKAVEPFNAELAYRSFPTFDTDGTERKQMYQDVLWAIREKGKEAQSQQNGSIDTLQMLKNSKDRHMWFVNNKDL